MDAAGESGPVVHSAVEASLYLLVTPCPNCGRGPVRAEATGATPSMGSSPREFRLPGACGACHATWNAKFCLSDDAPLATSTLTESDAPINSTSAPSSVIDVAQWITLCRMLLAETESCLDRRRARRLKVLAGRCVEEALKFYGDEENGLPPAAALFHEATRRVFRENPHEFARDRLLGLRAKLPSPIRER